MTITALPDPISKWQSRVLDNSIPEPNTGCWIWLAASRPTGYGNMWDSEKITGAHRVSYMAFNGEAPEGQLVCHRCDNPWCVNPEHLFLGSPLDNMQDMIAKGRKVVRMGPNKTTTTGIAGVAYHVSRDRDPRKAYWQVHIRVRGRKIYLGTARDKDIAIAMRRAGEAKYGHTDGLAAVPAPSRSGKKRRFSTALSQEPSP